MKYTIEISGRDINLIKVALRLRAESAEENADGGTSNDKFWAKTWRECLNRFTLKIKKIRGSK